MAGLKGSAVNRRSSVCRARVPFAAAALCSLLVLGVHAQEAHQAPTVDSMAWRVKACSACHGDQGRATPEGYFPRLAGKPADYLLRQMQNFRDGRRHHTQMGYLLAHLTDDYLREMAGYFAQRQVPYPPPLPPQAAAQVLDQIGRAHV